MFVLLSPLRKMLRPVAAISTALALSACDPSALTNLGSGSGGTMRPGGPVQVALLVPQSDAGAAPVARALENAARLALTEQGATNIDLRVYDTAGQAGVAAQQAQKAVDDGAKIILGPLFGEAANAAGVAVADEGVNVLSFSNNPSIAGGNVFILGPTFYNTADRMMSFARRQGRKNIVIVNSNDVPGQFGRAAIEQAAAANGIGVTSSQPYDLSVEGVTATAQAVGQIVASGAADSAFITTDATNEALQILLRQLPANGVTPGQVQFIGLTRWDVRPDLFSLPGANGAWFAIPDQSRSQAFASRYNAAYGTAAHPLASLAYDGISAIIALSQRGDLSSRALTSNVYVGTGGAFRFSQNGTNSRALAVASVQNNQMVILDPAPSTLGSAGF